MRPTMVRHYYSAFSTCTSWTKLPSPDKAADILAALCMRISTAVDRPLPPPDTTNHEESPTWLLKANVTVFRHADRTPKVK